jgi:hypothetical protein
MNRITRMLTVSGLGLIAAATMGAGPAMAASGTDAAATTGSTAGVQSHNRYDDDDDRVVGYYLRRCVIAGRIGERFDRWDDFDCERVGWGFHRRWALEVSWDHDDWDDNWYNWDRDDYRDSFRGPNRHYRHTGGINDSFNNGNIVIGGR